MFKIVIECCRRMRESVLLGPLSDEQVGGWVEE